MFLIYFFYKCLINIVICFINLVNKMLKKMKFLNVFLFLLFFIIQVKCLRQDSQKLLEEIKALNETVEKQKNAINGYEKELNNKKNSNNALSEKMNINISNNTNSTDKVTISKNGTTMTVSDTQTNITNSNKTEPNNNPKSGPSNYYNSYQNGYGASSSSGYLSPSPASLSEYALYSQLQFDLLREKNLRQEVDDKLASISVLESNFTSLYNELTQKYRSSLTHLKSKMKSLTQNTNELEQKISEIQKNQVQTQALFNISLSMTSSSSECESRKNCDECLSSPKCVWCLSEENCQEGDMYGPFESKCQNGYEYNKCPNNDDVKRFLQA